VKKCKNCGNDILSKNSIVFCGRSCSAIYNNKKRIHSDESKRKRSVAAVNAWGRGVYNHLDQFKRNRLNKKCISCGNEFETVPSNNYQSCSIECKNYAYENNLYDLKGKSGGYRKGSGRGKSGWYKGIWCDSSYELAWVMYNLDHNIPFQRNAESFEYEYNGEVHLYYPDFRMLDTNELVEIKGFYTEQTYAKLKSVVNTTLKILNKDDMVSYVQYASEKYGQNFISYYEGNPHNQMTNRCKQCGNPCKKKSVYCSRQCAGRGNNRNSKVK